MKILQINNCHFRRGGADVVYLNTTDLLLKNGHEVICFSQKTENNINLKSKEYFIDQIDFFKLSYVRKLLKTPRFFYSTEAKNKLESLLKTERPEIAHIHTYKGTLTPSILIPLKKHNIPVVITLHDYGFLCPHNLFLDGKGQVCEKCLTSNNSINCIINKCNRNNIFLSTISSLEFAFHKNIIPFSKFFDKLIAVSKFGLEIHSRKGEFKEKLHHLYNFYPGFINSQPNANKGNYFLYFGRLSHEKGIHTLLKAWANIKSDMMLKIVGDGPLMVQLKEFIIENKISNVDMIGFKKGEELISLINNASFIIVPSECYENNPLTIIEAYANGKPVIASQIGGITEIVVQNKTGFLFEKGNIGQLTQNIERAFEISDEEYVELSKNARKFSEDNFSEDKHYNELIDIYKNTINGRKSTI